MAAYLLAEIQRITDPEMYRRYVDAARPIVVKHGGAYMVCSDKVETFSGESAPERVLLIRFPDRQSLAACFQSKEYTEIAPLRETSTDSRALVMEDE